MSRVSVARMPEEAKNIGGRELLARLCYYYPQYTLAAARRLPYKDVVLLLKTANKLEAEKHINLLNINAAPNAKNGVKDMANYYKGIIKNG